MRTTSRPRSRKPATPPTDGTRLAAELRDIRTRDLGGMSFDLDTHASMQQLRVARAEAAVTIGTDYDADEETDHETYAADLVANLRHWADAHGIDWAEVMRRGEGHYEAEKAEMAAAESERTR